MILIYIIYNYTNYYGYYYYYYRFIDIVDNCVVYMCVHLMTFRAVDTYE